MTGVRAKDDDATELAVAVPGGDLAVVRWPAEGRDGGLPVLVVHGITGNALTWAAVARRLPDVDVLAPDVRGRAHSRAVSGPYGIRRHADDLALVLDELGVTEPVVLAGHSMGAFIACVAAVRHPDRFRRLVLVDGGYDFRVPVTGDVDAALNETLGPSMARLSMEFESFAAYQAFWQAHPAFAGQWTADADAYIERDLIGVAPHLRSSCVIDAVRTDGGDVFADEDVHAAIRRLSVPATLLWAERGLRDEPVGLYTREGLTSAGLPDTVDVVAVPGTNHFSIMFGDTGADAVAAAVRAAIRASVASG
ncbi:MAG TPA: alpha/beta hydrolase [Pseudonocardiaceae bacterium]|nr:alpha/beta hydrolase [Pseudonocardiaceae bacterium]